MYGVTCCAAQIRRNSSASSVRRCVLTVRRFLLSHFTLMHSPPFKCTVAHFTIYGIIQRIFPQYMRIKFRCTTRKKKEGSPNRCSITLCRRHILHGALTREVAFAKQMAEGETHRTVFRRAAPHSLQRTAAAAVGKHRRAAPWLSTATPHRRAAPEEQRHLPPHKMTALRRDTGRHVRPEH